MTFLIKNGPLGTPTRHNSYMVPHVVFGVKSGLVDRVINSFCLTFDYLAWYDVAVY